MNGSPVLFRVSAPLQLTELQGNFLGQEFSFRSSSCMPLLVRICRCKPGDQAGHVHVARRRQKSGRERSHYELRRRRGAAHYPTSALKVAPGFVEPPKETLGKIEEDQAEKKEGLLPHRCRKSTLVRAFLAAGGGRVFGVFGSARVFNGVKKSQHTGLDFRVTTGTPIVATNSGTVILARPLYFEGNCVMIDHGQGLLTMYLHLSEFKVKEGDTVTEGPALGLSGGTGRATAPHLHFAVRWRGEYLDPRTLLELHPPGS